MRVREPVLAFAHASAAGALRGVDWVAPRFDGEGYGDETALSGEPRFSGPPMSLPPPMREAAEDAQAAGQATLAEALSLLIAGPAWLIESRRTLWTPLSAVPALLARLVETYGIGAEVHRRDPERLARLAARVAAWYPHRGQLPATLTLLEEALGEPAPRAALPAAERVACHAARWWADRGGARPHYRVEGGFLRFQRPEEPCAEPTREDVLAGQIPSTALLRLLPVWTSLRLTL